MSRRLTHASLLALLVALAACAAPGHAPDSHDDAGVSRDAGEDGGASDAGTADKSAACASAFGSALTNAFGRLDGTVVAVVEPGNERCAMPNRDHLVVQVEVDGAAYRMVLNVLSDGRNGTDTRLRYAEVRRALAAPAWAEGWHTGVSLDYATQLSVHPADFTPYAMDELVARVSDRLVVGAQVSVYATSRDRPESAHLIHRNGRQNDGAIVVDPDSADPLFLLFHFDGQTF